MICMNNTFKFSVWFFIATICINRSFAQTGSLFNFIRTVEVTPDAMYLTGSFSRINYIPATGHFFVSFGTKASTEEGVCNGAGFAYKMYTPDMQETGVSGLLQWYPNACESGDAGSTMDGDSYYFVESPQGTDVPYGLRITKLGTVNWTRLKEKFVYMLDTFEANSDPCVAFVNGQLDVSDQYNPSGIWQEGSASRHHFFTSDLDSVDVRILDDSPNISGASMIYVDGVYYLISASEYSEGLVVLKYDNNWNFIEMNNLIDEANWSQGVAFDGQRFFVAYLDTHLRSDPYFFPVYNNVHVAVFDRDWNILDDIAVTDYDKTDNCVGGRPWVILHDNRMYVSYDVDSLDPVTHEELLKWQARVGIYELAPVSSAEQVEIVKQGIRLEQNEPNPFSDFTSIKFSLSCPERVTLKVYNTEGREVSSLVNELKQPGEYTVRFDATDFKEGVYYYRLVAGDYIRIRKCIKIGQ
jgi:hypothetical protein